MATIILCVATIIIGVIMLKGVFGKIGYLVIVAGIVTIFSPFGVMLGIPVIISFIGMKRESTPTSLTIATWVSFLTGIFLWVLKIISTDILTFLGIATASISLLMIYREYRRRVG